MITKLFLEFFKKHIVISIAYLTTMIYIPFNSIGMPHLYGKLISNLNKGPFNKSIYLLGLLIVLWSVIQLIKILSSYLHSKIFPIFMAFIRGRIVNIIIERYKNNYEDLQIGDTITKIIKAPWLFEDIFDSGEDFIFRNILLVFSSFMYLFMYNKTLGCIYLVCIGCIILICKIYISDCQNYVKKSEDIYDNIHEEIEDTLSNLISVYTSQKVDDENRRLDVLNKKVYKSQQSLENCNNKYRFFYSALCIAIFIALNFYSIYIYRKKQVKIETLIAIIIINYSLLNSLMGVYYYARRLTDIKGRIDIFEKYLNGLPHSSNDNILKLDKIDDINLKNICFSYDKNPILNNINLQINNNDIIGLIGHIGSGKSTIGKLLVRLKEPQKGEIIIKNININKLNIDNLRDHINYIPQHPKLFNRTLFNNITYGIKRTINEEEIYKLLDDLDANNINKKFKSMMFKKVGKNGSNLSGGQRQLVWLIRSILKNSKVIILDEPTSSLDDTSKLQVIKFIKKYTKNKIVIIITHDKSLLENVNRIIELKNGSVLKDTRK
jgi:ABC-type multidrug transport system fused ATPase/permease subunit